MPFTVLAAPYSTWVESPWGAAGNGGTSRSVRADDRLSVKVLELGSVWNENAHRPAHASRTIGGSWFDRRRRGVSFDSSTRESRDEPLLSSRQVLDCASCGPWSLHSRAAAAAPGSGPFRGNTLRPRGRRVSATARHLPPHVRARPRAQNIAMLYAPAGTACRGARPGAPGGSRTATAPPTAPCRRSRGAVRHLPAELPGPVVQPDGRRQAVPANSAAGSGSSPDGCLCDAARPGWIVYKQGDGRSRSTIGAWSSPRPAW